MKDKIEVVITGESPLLRKLQYYQKQYVDDYDRVTIQKLKLLEENLPEDYAFGLDYSIIDLLALSRDKNCKVATFFSQALSRAKNREVAIKQLSERSAYEDRLIKDNPIPQSICCNTCKREMFFDSHIFKNTPEEQILFVFLCPAKHKPKKVVYPNGQEYQIKEAKCNCGGRLEHSSIKKDNLLILIDTCTSCGKEDIMELDTTDEVELPINEDDRKKYCLQFLSIPHYLRDLESFQKVVGLVDKESKENEARKLYEVDNIQKMNVPALEVLLKKEVENAGYTKFEFIKTDLSKFVMVTFLANDPSERTKSESVRQLTKLINATLFTHNWRLISNSVEYRLGVLTGRVRAYETEDDLLALAKKIYEKSKG